MKQGLSFLFTLGVVLVLLSSRGWAGEGMVSRDSKAMVETETDDSSSVYLRALRDLHLARAYVSRADPKQGEVDALVHIDNAIHALQLASVYNCDDYNLHPATDGTLNKYDRYRIGLQILDQVKEYLKPNPTDRFNLGYQGRALSELNSARDEVRDLLHTEE